MHNHSCLAAIAAALCLAACSPDPVDPAVLPDNQVDGSSTDVPAAPGNAAAAEAHKRASAPLAGDGMAWIWRAETSSALFGPGASEPQLSIECRGGVLHITRHAAIENAAGTLSFTGNGHAASLPVNALRSQLGPGSLSTTALKVGDMTNAVARVFEGNGPVQVSLGGAPSLVTPPSDVPGRAFDACR
jgi:hypothetical protein